MKRLVLIFVLVIFAGSFAYADDVPHQINYQGYVTSGGSAYSGTGYFKFSLINDKDSPTANFWTNDGSSPSAGGEPTNAISTTVSSGVFNVILGDTTITNMTQISTGVFADLGSSTVYLRVWFSTSASGTFEQLSPDKKVTSSVFAYRSASVNSQIRNAVIICPYGLDSGNTGELSFFELSANGINYVGFKGPNSISTNLIWTLPNADGSSGQALSTDGAGVLGWTSTGDITAVGSMISQDAFAGTEADDAWLGLGSDAGRIEFDNQDTDEVNIQSAYVGIGTSTPEYKLDVDGTIRTGMNGTDGKLKIYSEQGGTDYTVTINPHETMTQNTTYTLPADDGGSNQFLQTNGSGALTWASAGDVSGPASSTGNAIVRFDGTGGKTIQNTTGVTIDDSYNIQAGNSTTDCGAITMIKGAQSGDPQFQISLSSDVNGHATLTPSVGDLFVNIAGGNLAPSSNDGAALGISGIAFSDLFLASGAVINFNAGDITLTHSSEVLTMAGGNMVYTLGASDGLSINAFEPDNTLAISGVLDLVVDSSTNNNKGLHVNYQSVDDNAIDTLYASLIELDIDDGADTVYGQYISVGQDDTAATAWGLYVTGADKNYFSGAVGIGNIENTIPEGLLEVQGSDNNDAVIYLDADRGDNNEDTWIIRSDTDNDFYITNHTTDIVDISESGWVGIGTTATSSNTVSISGDEGTALYASSSNASGTGVYGAGVHGVQGYATTGTGGYFTSSSGGYAIRTGGGNVGIADSSPASLLTVGNGDLFQVDSTGDIIKIQNVTYDWPSAQGGATTVLTNNGSGTLSWGAKAFIINHPMDKDKILVHACLEGPENGVYYRGVIEIEEPNKVVEVELPQYFEYLVRKEGRTVLATVIEDYDNFSSETIPNVKVSKVSNGKFKITANGTCSVSWEVKGIRRDLDNLPVEINKTNYIEGKYPELERRDISKFKDVSLWFRD